MEKLFSKDFDLPPKDRSEEALINWRKAVGLVKNRCRRFRYVTDLEKRFETNEQIRILREKIRVGFLAYIAALKFIDGISLLISLVGMVIEQSSGKDNESSEAMQDDSKAEFVNGLQDEARAAGFSVHPDKLSPLVASYDIKTLRKLEGVKGLSNRLKISLDEGVKSSDVHIRQNIFGSNVYTEKPSKSFWMFVWEALQDLTLIILMVCAVVSVGVGLATEGWPKGMYDGLGILFCVILVVMVTAVSDYKQSLQFKALDKEKKKIFIQVTRDRTRQKVSIYDLVVGDVVHLSIGDRVPADGIFISGHSLLVDQSSLTGECVPDRYTRKKTFSVSRSQAREEKRRPQLQVKLNGVASIIGKIGLAFAVLTFLVLTIRFLVEKGLHHEFTKWSSNDAVMLLNYFATAVTIVVVAVPEGLPLAVTLSLAFAMKKLMNDKALGTLTTNHMAVNKIWICGIEKEVETSGSQETFDSDIPENAFTILLQAIFLNTGSEVVKNKDGKRSILGTPTESAILEYGLLLGGDFDYQRRDCELSKVEPFNSEKKKMSVLVTLPNGKVRAFCKGASEIILKSCDRTIDANGKPFHLSDEHTRNIMNVINGFASEALRTLCLAFKDIDEDFDKNRIPDYGYTLIAVVGIKDPVRPGVKEAVKTCLAAGITVRMVTGDNIHTAKAIAKECSILNDGDLAIEGPEFRHKTPDEMKQIIPRIKVMARSSPTDKHVLVKNSRSLLKEVVAVTGDGTNDAPALH
ncbi:putative calcium-transporting ATPase 11 [Forsythia ovata]|uniref:Calcium-transporting ATPase 11 n=1 Tax=Forsythia ovata TaxID=205694 RepID=A0ABD1PL68_9LAMI